MKPAQWIGAVLAGAAMVFVITFALNYLGGNSSSGGGDTPSQAEALQLTFPVFQAPSGGTAPAIVTETKQPAWYDYWFRNENDRPVRIGMAHKNCKCSHVELYVLPDDWESRLPDGWDKVQGFALAAARQALSAQLLAEKLTPVKLDQFAEGEVPARGQGWVRMGWSGEHPGPQQINTTLWTDNKEGPTVILNARVMYHAPAEAVTNILAGTLHVRQLEKTGSVTVKIPCWSATRSSFRLEAHSDATREPKSDPFVVGKPVPLTAADKARLEKQDTEFAGSVRCGWTVPVTLRAVSEDNHTPFELGPFHRWVVLTSPDEGIEPIRVMVTGRVVGDVTANGDEEGRVIFGNFVRSRGTSWHTVLLESETPGMELKLEEKRVPKYLEVRFPAKPEGSSSGHQSWKMEVRVREGAARGQFPRDGDPEYADSAVYVQIAGKTPRSIRVAVSGTANDG
jgi:hypothetical protein